MTNKEKDFMLETYMIGVVDAISAYLCPPNFPPMVHRPQKRIFGRRLKLKDLRKTYDDGWAMGNKTWTKIIDDYREKTNHKLYSVPM